MEEEISSGHNVVSDDESCTPGRSWEGLNDTHFHDPSACLGLGLCRASSAAHDGPLSILGLLPNLRLHPTHDLHDGPYMETDTNYQTNNLQQQTLVHARQLQRLSDLINGQEICFFPIYIPALKSRQRLATALWMRNTSCGYCVYCYCL